MSADTVRWHAHGFTFVHAHPDDALGHGHDGYMLVAARGEAARLVDDEGVRLPGETTMLEAVHAARFDGEAGG